MLEETLLTDFKCFESFNTNPTRYSPLMTSAVDAADDFQYSINFTSSERANPYFVVVEDELTRGVFTNPKDSP